jgi:hypothetical protein
VDTGFPIGNATNIESRALSGCDPCNFLVNLIGKRSSGSFKAAFENVRSDGARLPLTKIGRQAAPARACFEGL